jgi:tetratricopeptide (TPR) repeat protein
MKIAGIFGRYGENFFDQKRYDSARFYMRKAVNKDPDNVQYYNTLGLSFQGLKLYDSARVNLQKRIDFHRIIELCFKIYQMFLGY